jgi:hypothetical protein
MGTKDDDAANESVSNVSFDIGFKGDMGFWDPAARMKLRKIP